MAFVCMPPVTCVICIFSIEIVIKQIRLYYIQNRNGKGFFFSDKKKNENDSMKEHTAGSGFIKFHHFTITGLTLNRLISFGLHLVRLN